MKQPLFFFFVMMGLRVINCSQEMVDFTYSKYVQKDTAKSDDLQGISIHPNSQTIQGFHFPEACLVTKKINGDVLEDSTEMQNLDSDSMIDELKKYFV